MRKIIALLAILIILLAGLTVCNLAGRIAVYLFSKAYNLDISYKRFPRASCREFLFEDLKIKDKKSGIGLFAKDAVIRPGRSGLNFNIYSAGFYREGAGKTNFYSDLAGLVSLPFSGQWIYKEISGSILPAKNGIEFKDILAVGDDIKLRLTAVIHDKDLVDANIKIYFSDIVSAGIPKELSGVILNDEGSGWKSLSVSLEGNYRSPSIQVSSRLFRLNIGAVAETTAP